MKRVFCFIVTFSVILSLFNIQGIQTLASPTVSAASAILIDAETGDILYEKDAYSKRSMASTTKIMTSLLALEHGELDEIHTMTKDMVGIEGSSIYLLEGDKVSLRTLIYGMLLSSGNDAANATAIIVGGSKDEFVDMMNKRAAELGMKNTHFCNPEGLEDENHYSTAYDMALLGACAAKNLDFIQISSTKTATFDYGTPVITHYFSNHNKLLTRNKYDGINGLKTGYTKAAGRCLVSSVVRNGVNLICVTLNAPDDWNDHIKLFDYGFSQYSDFEYDTDTSGISVPVIGGMSETLGVYCNGSSAGKILSKNSGSVVKRVTINKFVYAPVAKGEQVGTIDYLCGEKVVKSIPLLANETIGAETTGWFSDLVGAFAVTGQFGG